MADAFNNFFANIENNLTKNIPSVNKSALQYLTAPSQDSFFLFPTKPLEIIFNASFSTGIVPDLFKIALVTPIFKKGVQTSLNNYHPISVLSISNKLLEKVVHKRILEFLKKKSNLLQAVCLPCETLHGSCYPKHH